MGGVKRACGARLWGMPSRSLPSRDAPTSASGSMASGMLALQSLILLIASSSRFMQKQQVIATAAVSCKIATFALDAALHCWVLMSVRQSEGCIQPCHYTSPGIHKPRNVVSSDFHQSNIRRPCRNAEDKPAWRDKTCATHT